MDKVFSHGKELIDIIESQHWQIYQVPNDPSKIIVGVDELTKNDPAKEIDSTSSYMFIPRPLNGETIKFAYITRYGYGPSLVLDENKQPIDKTIIGNPDSKQLMFFNRLYFKDEFIIISNLNNPARPTLNTYAIHEEFALEVFRCSFRVFTIDELVSNGDDIVVNKRRYH